MTGFAGTRAWPTRGNVIRLEDQLAKWARRAALATGAASLALFAALVWQQGIPRSIEPRQWEILAQIAVLTFVGLGYLSAWRWEIVGAITMLVGSVALGVLASIAYEPRDALAGCMAFFVPGVLFALHWQRRHGYYSLAALFGALAALLVFGGVASARVYDYYYGPTHPASHAEAIDVDVVDWIWTGGVTPRSFEVTARSAEEGQLELLVAPADRPAAVVHIRPSETSKGGVVHFDARGLEPDTEYTYTVRHGSNLDEGRSGSLRTFPDGPATFTVALSSCILTGSNGQVFDQIGLVDPSVFLITGDFHYEDISSNDPDRMREAFERNLTSPAQQALYLDTPIAYVWDDHDFGGNDSSAVADSRFASSDVYHELVPHYQLGEAGPVAISQAFTIGRTRFILLDTRSARTPDAMPDGPDKTMLGSAQKAWLKQQLLGGKGPYPLTVLVSSVPWIAEEKAGADNWGGFATERREIANFIASNNIDGLAIVSGDAHMLAIDDGTNSDYSDSGYAPIPVLQAGALDRRGTTKGGPYSEGAYPGGGQFATMTVEDHGGDTVTVTWTGLNWKGETIVSYSFETQVSR